MRTILSLQFFPGSFINSLAMMLSFLWNNCSRRLLVAVAFASLLPLSARAQNSLVWTTNFYNVTGSNFREIRQSIAKARPWKDNFDGDTRWDIRWNFQYSPRAGGCAVTRYAVTTKIVTTLPRWTPPADAALGVKTQWTRFYTTLAQHEAGHARLGLAAAAEVSKKLGETPAQSECEALRKRVNDQAEAVIADYRVREKEYDRRTNHGAIPDGSP